MTDKHIVALGRSGSWASERGRSSYGYCPVTLFTYVAASVSHVESMYDRVIRTIPGSYDLVRSPCSTSPTMSQPCHKRANDEMLDGSTKIVSR